MFRNVTICVAAAVIGLAMVGHAAATTYTFQPNPTDLWDLDHSRYYSWGFAWDVPSGVTITSATLEIVHINNTQEPEYGDHLYIHLIDDPTIGTYSYWDGNSYSDNWASAGPLVANYSDSGTSYVDLSYDLGSLGLLDDFTAYLADGTVGFGFDPDCHYTNSYVKLSVEVTPTPTPVNDVVPEPMTMATLVPAVIGLGAYLRRRLGR